MTPPWAASWTARAEDIANGAIGLFRAFPGAGRPHVGARETPMLLRWIATMTVLTAAACAPAPIAAPPAPPAQAQLLTEPGAHDRRLDVVEAEFRDALEASHGKLTTTAYRLPVTATWTDVEAHYQTGLSTWQAEPALPAHIRAADARAWKRPGAVVAIALIDSPVPGEALDYKILAVATKRSGADS